MISSNFDKNCITGAVFLDLKKAFDTVDHNILCHKLAQYGVTGRSNAWVANYLSDRVQKVKFNSAVSDSSNFGWSSTR